MTGSDAEQALPIVRRFYELLGADRFEEALPLLSEGLVIHESPDLPYGGDYHGHAGNMELMGKVTSVLNIAIAGHEFLSTTNPIVVKVLARFGSKKTGETVDLDVIEILTVRNGKISEIEVFYKTPSVVNALWSQ